MMTFRRTLIATSLLALLAVAIGLEAADSKTEQKVTTPEVITRVEPDASGLTPKDGKIFVELSLSVDSEGKVVDAKASSFSHRVYATRAVEAARKWRFKPANENGYPVSATVKVRIVPKGA